MFCEVLSCVEREEWQRRLSTVGNWLGNLLTVYFGQDWVDDYGEPWTNVTAAFGADAGPERVRATVSELGELLADGLTEGDLEWLLHEGIHSAVAWDRFGYPSWTAWLEAVRDELRRLC